MIEVGVRQLKNALSRYLERVRGGETLVVTDRGRPVARVIPMDIPEHIGQLISEGRMTWSGRRFTPPRKTVRPKPGPPISAYVSEDRF